MTVGTLRLFFVIHDADRKVEMLYVKRIVADAMNYLAHGFRFTDEPYFLAGTAAPDWLSVIDRKMRLRVEDGGRSLWTMPIRNWRRWPAAWCSITTTTSGFIRRRRSTS